MPDDRYIEWLLASQRGVLSRPQALAGGVTTRHGLEHRLRPGGPWQRLLPGVYLTVTGQPSFEQLQVAALLYAGAKSFITGSAALTFYGIRGPRTKAIDVLVPADHSVVSRSFVVVNRTRRLPVSWHHDLTLRYVVPARATADAVRTMRRLDDARTVVASAVQQHLCTVGELAAELAERHRPGDALLRTVLTEVAAGIRSAPEGDLRELIANSSLPEPLYNPDLYLDGTFLARPDAWWPRAAVAVEVDSMEWHLLPGDWQQTLRRGRRMTAAGIFVIHVTPGQLRGEPQQVLADIASALDRGHPATLIIARPAAA